MENKSALAAISNRIMLSADMRIRIEVTRACFGMRADASAGFYQFTADRFRLATSKLRA